MQIYKIKNFNKYQIHKNKRKTQQIELKAYINKLIDQKENTYLGYSYTANQMVNFKINYAQNGSVNWRESLVCPISGLNNRSRLSIFLCDVIFNFYDNEDIYITEQTTPMYRYIEKKYTNEYNSNIIGSEFISENLASGSVTSKGIRNESLTNLSFKDKEIDKILTFDVLEHIPDYKNALKECYRVLSDNGIMIVSVPFILDSKQTLTRAYLDNENNIVHNTEPEYHGDPVNKNGILCFYHFGWDLLDDFRNAGFSNAYVVLATSKEFGNFGNSEQSLIIVEK